MTVTLVTLLCVISYQDASHSPAVFTALYEYSPLKVLFSSAHLRLSYFTAGRFGSQPVKFGFRGICSEQPFGQRGDLSAVERAKRGISNFGETCVQLGPLAAEPLYEVSIHAAPQFAHRLQVSRIASQYSHLTPAPTLSKSRTALW